MVGANPGVDGGVPAAESDGMTVSTRFWQRLYPAGTHRRDDGFDDGFPAILRDGREILLPIRTLPGTTTTGIASLIVNQASFVVHDALVAGMVDLARPHAPDVVVGVPTLGLSLAPGVARGLGHERFVPLGTSRKFWYEDRLSEPMSSITSPGQSKTLFLDPRLLPLVAERRVLLVDDVVSTGRSLGAALRLLAKAGVKPVAVVVAMRQTERWRALPELADGPPVLGVIDTPALEKGGDGHWRPVQASETA
jgi:adenine/guanine phosphoribosyltransferase-like PRPP-binding protein